MNILVFSPSATPETPSMCPFITQRIFELQRQGHNVIVLQYGNLMIKSPFVTRQIGFMKILAIVFHIFKFFFHRNQIRIFKSSLGEYEYYNNLNFFSYNQFYRWYQKNRFDLIHAHFLWFSNQLPLLRKKFGIPYVVTVHGSDMHQLTLYDKEKVMEMLEILNNAESCIFVSHFLFNHARRLGYRGENNHIIHNGIDFKYFYPNSIKQNHDIITLGFIGHPNFIKRSYILPMVLKLVKQNLPNTKLLILGSERNDLLPYIKLQAWTLGLENDIEFISAVPPEQVGEYMRNIDVLLLPSHNEGFPCVAIEAQACGVGVIGSANGGIPEAVGKNGICVPDTEYFIRDFANAIVEWFKNDHDLQNISESVKLYSWEICVKKEIEIYRAILQKS